MRADRQAERGDTPLISVVIPAYQHGPELPLCLRSLFRQTLTDFEVVLVNDGSIDDTEEAISPFIDRIKYIKQENRGGNAARNRGANAATGRYLFFCDADLILKPKALERLFLALQQHPEAAYAYCSFRYGLKVFRLWEFDADRLRQINYIHTSSLIRKECFPGFDENIRKLQDWDLWLTMLEQGHQGVWVPERLFKAIPHKGGISTWVPGFFYRVPWSRFGIRMPAVEKFQKAEKIIKQKHCLP